MKKVLIIIAGILVVVAIALGLYAYRNLNYDFMNENFMEKEGKKLGFEEKQVQTPDQLTLNYGEGPDNGPVLVLLHGQNASWKDYAKVLPDLNKDFHIFAIDYYGHGGSSKDPQAYTAVKIGEDLTWFIEEVIGEPVIVSGHSSGALLTAWLAAYGGDLVQAAILEDGPFFSTEPGRAEQTFAYMGFKNIHDYFNQDEIETYIEYDLNHNAMKPMFNRDGGENWENIVLNPALKQLEKDPHKIPKLWYFPPELGVNGIYQLAANLQDGNGDYDLLFGLSFYDFSWFEGFDQEETLKQIKIPTLVMHVAPSKETAPSYYDENGILLSAMDEQDAQRVVDLIDQAQYVGGFESMHDIHADLPKEFVARVRDFIGSLDLN